MTRLRNALGWVIDVREGEAVPVALLTLYGFLALASFHLIKPVRNAIFLDRVGSGSLPLVYAITALIVIVLSVLYSRAAERADHHRLLQATLATLALSLVGFWWWLREAEGSVIASGAFYIWAKLYPLALVSQFWLVGNLLFTTRQAKRLFGAIGTGLILGGIAGAAVSGEAADALGSVNLLLVAAGLLAACSALLPRVLAERAGDRGASARIVDELSAGGLTILRDSSHLRTVAAVLGLAVIVATLVDWQFNRAVDLFIAGEDAKTVFFGRFFALTNVAAAGVQVLLTAYVLRRLGVGVAALALPAALLVAGLGVALAPLLLTAALLKGTEAALRYSLDQSTRELLYLPVPTETKFKVKPLIDLGVYRGAGGVAGLLLILLVNGLGFSIRGVAVATLLFVVAWIVVALRLRGEFRAAVRRLIGVRDVELDQLIVEHLGAEAIDELRRALGREDERHVLFALALLERGPPAGLGDELEELLDHDSERVRTRAIAALHRLDAVDAVDEVERLLEDPSLEVRREAIQYLCGRAPDGPAERMERFLDERGDVREAAVACLVQHGDDAQMEKGFGLLREMAQSDSEERRGRAAILFGDRSDLPRGGRALLRDLMEDDDPGVRREAMRAAGRAGSAAFVPLLIDRIADEALRDAALEALGSMGQAVHDDALDAFADPSTHTLSRILLPKLLYPDASQGTVDRLLAMIPELPPGLRYEALRVLNKLRRDRDDLAFEAMGRKALVAPEVEAAYRWTAAAADLETEEDADGRTFLERTVRQRRSEAIERAFRALGLWLPLEDLYAAFTALASSDAVTRERGFELLENVLPLRDREGLGPLVDPERSVEDGARAGGDRYGIERMEPGSRLEALAEADDFWVRVLARRALGRPVLEGDVPSIESGRADTLLATAGPFEDEERLMDVIERAELLSRAEMFCELSTEDLAGLATLMEEAEYAAGEEIFAEGDGGGVLYLVAEGRIEARKGDRVLFDADRGKSVGSLSLVDGLPTDYTAVAVEDTRALTLERAEFTRMLEERPPVARSVMTYLTSVIRGLNEPPGG